MSSFSSTGEHCTAPAVSRQSKDSKGRGPRTTLAIQSEPQPTRPGGAGKASSGKPPMTAKGVISLLQDHRTFPKAGCRHKTRSCLKCNADKERVLKTSCLPRSLSSAPRLFKRRSRDLSFKLLPLHPPRQAVLSSAIYAGGLSEGSLLQPELVGQPVGLGTKQFCNGATYGPMIPS